MENETRHDTNEMCIGCLSGSCSFQDFLGSLQLSLPLLHQDSVLQIYGEQWLSMPKVGSAEIYWAIVRFRMTLRFGLSSRHLLVCFQIPPISLEAHKKSKWLGDYVFWGICLFGAAFAGYALGF